MFRGMASGDCSTEQSAGFSASPFERVFFILDNQGNPLGYLSLTLVGTSNGREVAYVHTIDSWKKAHIWSRKNGS